MNKKRIIVILGIIFLFVTCYFTINIKYDRLARYPFGNGYERVAIENKLDDAEIDYIVEYAIEPDYFIQYINCSKFNIYHLDLYKHFSQLFPYLSNEESVTIVERLFLLNKANDDFYNKILSMGEDEAYRLLRTYS